MKQESKLKMVKNSNLRQENNVIIIRHYETDIFKYDLTTKKAYNLVNCSATSNRMIRRANEFFNVSDESIKVEYCPEKWMYSQPLEAIQ